MGKESGRLTRVLEHVDVLGSNSNDECTVACMQRRITILYSSG
jgi:hypothetical protein